MKRIFLSYDDAVQACTSNLALFSYYCDAHLLITVRITVHDIANYILLQLVVRELISHSQLQVVSRRR